MGQSLSQCPCCRSKKQSAEDDDSGRNVEPIMRHCLSHAVVASLSTCCKSATSQARLGARALRCHLPRHVTCASRYCQHASCENAEPSTLFSGISILCGAEWSLVQGVGEHVFFLASDCMASFVAPTSPAASTVTNPSSCATQVSGCCEPDVLRCFL